MQDEASYESVIESLFDETVPETIMHEAAVK